MISWRSDSPALMEGDEEDLQWFEEVLQLARDRSAFFLPVRLTILPEELA
jgi:hypothetical protein